MNTFPRSGNLKPAEIKPLILAAKTAYDRQADAGLLDPSETFDDWRHAQCVAAVGKPGFTACHHDDFQPLLAHFYTLSADTEKAYEAAMKTGKPTDHAAPGDTWEIRRNFARQIAGAITRHGALGGKIGVGYVVTLARHKTRRPTLTLGTDWEAGLVLRCTADQLAQIRDTILNRLAAAEGRGITTTRNKLQSRRGFDADSNAPF